MPWELKLAVNQTKQQRLIKMLQLYAQKMLKSNKIVYLFSVGYKLFAVCDGHGLNGHLVSN